MLRRILGSKGDKTIGDCRRLHNDEFHDLYPSPSVVHLIKWSRMRWVGHVAHTGESKLQGFGGET